jgi:hypothetical protein
MNNERVIRCVKYCIKCDALLQAFDVHLTQEN